MRKIVSYFMLQFDGQRLNLEIFRKRTNPGANFRGTSDTKT